MIHDISMYTYENGPDEIFKIQQVLLVHPLVDKNLHHNGNMLHQVLDIETSVVISTIAPTYLKNNETMQDEILISVDSRSKSLNLSLSLYPI